MSDIAEKKIVNKNQNKNETKSKTKNETVEKKENGKPKKNVKKEQNADKTTAIKKADNKVEKVEAEEVVREKQNENVDTVESKEELKDKKEIENKEKVNNKQNTKRGKSKKTQKIKEEKKQATEDVEKIEDKQDIEDETKAKNKQNIEEEKTDNNQENEKNTDVENNDNVENNEGNERTISLEDVKKAIENKVNNTQKRTIIKDCIINIGIAIIMVAYLIIVLMGSKNILSETLELDMKIMTLSILAIGIVVLEVAYRKDKSKLAMNGIEVLTFGATNLCMIYILKLHFNNLINSVTYIGIAIGAYYILKSILLAVLEIKKFKRNNSDIKEIVKKKKVEVE